jgi:hypothetical protein
MVGYSKAAMERALKVQEVILRALAKRWDGGPGRSRTADQQFRNPSLQHVCNGLDSFHAVANTGK